MSKTRLKIRTKPMSKSARKKYEAAIKRLDKELKPMVDVIRDSQRIGAKDLSIVINTK